MGRLWYGFIVVCLAVQTGVAVAETTEERLQRLEQTIEDMKRHEAREREVEGQPPATRPGEAPNVQQLGAEGQGAERKYGSIMQGSGKLIYARPFVANPKAIVGGYMDFEFISRARRGHPNSTGTSPVGVPSMEVNRFVPFIYGDISEHVKFASELEIEHGIRANTGQNEISLEFATIDYLVNDMVNLRAGIILLPIGKFNLLHDAPLQDLTERPLVSQFILPVVMAETGAGFYGTLYPSRRSKLDYEFYVTTGSNGFNSNVGNNGCPAGSTSANTFACTAQVNEINGLRNTRQRKSNVSNGLDNNSGKAVVGRLAFSPFLGLEVSGSGYYGTYDPFSDRKMGIWAVDWTFVRGPFELVGESVWVYMQDNARNLNGTTCVGSTTFGSSGAGTLTGNPCPERMHGYYIEGRYHFLPEWMTRMAPSFFRQEISTFTAVVRWDQINTNQNATTNGFNERERVTFGLNFRPTEDTVFKADFQYSPKEISVNNQRIHDTAFLLSAATYF
ncbi:hypothetical protein [Candidatus Nitrospira bockiana]